MNGKRRAALREAARLLSSASSLIEGALAEEQDSMENIPDNLQDGPLYETLSDNVDALENAVDLVSEASEIISGI